MLDQDRADAALDGLEQNPAVANALGGLAVEETLERVDLEELARPILGSFYDLVGDQAEEFLTETAVAIVAGGQVGPLWNILVGSTFAELATALEQPEEPDSPVGLNITQIADDLFAEFGLPAGLVPVADWRVELFEPDDLGRVRDVVQPAVQFGAWLPWLALGFLGFGIWLNRRAFDSVGAWLLTAGAVTVAFTWWARRLLESEIAQVNRERDRLAFEVVADALVNDGVQASVRSGMVLAVLGLVILISGRVLQSR